MSNKKEYMEIGSKTVHNSETESDELLLGGEEIDKYFESKRRKLHKTYIKGWKEDINKQGFARCLIASCNFMSSNILTLQNHHKTCDGIPVNGDYLCDYCWTCLSTEEELVGHKAICKKAPKEVPKIVEKSSDLNIKNDRYDIWESENEDENQGFEGNIVEVKLSEDNSISDEHSNFSSFSCTHCKCGFPIEKDHTKHQQNCSVTIKDSLKLKKPDNVHTRVIKQMESKGSGDNQIFQTGPELAGVEYRHKHAYRAEHENSWVIALEKYKYVKCMYQNCNFIAMSLEDMKTHFGYCNGDGSFAKFVCQYCNGRVTSEATLLKHVKKSHHSEHIKVEPLTDKNNDVLNSYSAKDEQNCNINASPNSKRSDNLHFRVIKQRKSKDLGDDHIIQPEPHLPEGQYRRRRAYRAEHKNSWALALEKYKYVKCIYQNCNFIAMSLEDMITHFGYCNGDGSFAKFVCPYCKGRVTSEVILLKHVEISHPSENIKVESLMEKNNDDMLNSSLNTQKSKENFELKEKSNKASKERKSCHKIWQDQIKNRGYGYCRKSLCNFMAADEFELKIHLKTCDGTPNFDLYYCEKCSYRLPTREELVHHIPFCNDDKIKYFSATANKMTNSQSEQIKEDDLEIGPVLRQYKTKRPKSYTKHSKANSNSNSTSEVIKPQHVACESTNAINNSDELELNRKGLFKPKTRGRPKKNKEVIKKTIEKETKEVTCAKCPFRGCKSKFVHHNFKVHFGLSWVAGEEPVDLSDEKLLIRLVKEAFKYTKKGTCEKCSDVKKSVLGFVTHIQNCGKSEEEKNALKVQCPYCGGKYLRYSLGGHIKFIHSTSEEKEVEKNDVAEEILSGKRRSAVKAVSKFQQVFNDDEPESNRESQYILYEKGNERLPKLNSKLNNLWYKLKREKKKIPCRHPNCHNISDSVIEAKTHHYRCPVLPDKVFLCEICDFYSIDESTVQSHVTTHRKYVSQKKSGGENEEDDDKEDYDELEEEEEEEEKEDKEKEVEEEVEEEEEEEEDEDGNYNYDLDESRKRKKKSIDDRAPKKSKFSMDVYKPDFEIEFRLKQNFCRREKIDNIRGIQFFSSGLDMTLQEDLLTSKSSEDWQQLHTTLQDWCHVPDKRFLPKLTKSVSAQLPGDEANWRRFERFESDLIGGIPVMFTGGSVRSMSWCKISCKRMMEKAQKQYLAITTAKKLDHLKDIHEKSLEKESLLQIWDCGPLNNDLTKSAPKFSLGMVHPGGEVWDMEWFPQDTYAEGTEERLTRLGLLATACEDGMVRVWSVCDPQQLKNTKELRIYKTDPVVTLIADEDVEESCFQLSVGLDGLIAGGYGNGNIAVWNLKNISSPFCKKFGKYRIIRAHIVFQAHKTAITALTFCPLNSRYISTAGLDRFVKMWDLEFPSVPIELFNKEYSLDNIWTMNWPSVIYNFDDVVINFNKGAVKFIKDIFTDRHQSTFAMEDTCLSLAFSDWLNALCGGSITGEVKFRLLKNLIRDQKRTQSTISSILLEKLENDECKETEKGTKKEKDFPRTYTEVVSEFGLVFKDNLGMDTKRPEKPLAHPEEFPIRAVNKIAFNPNFESFTHIALGYNCGLIRIQPLKELQSTMSLKFFLGKTQKENF